MSQLGGAQIRPLSRLLLQQSNAIDLPGYLIGLGLLSSWSWESRGVNALSSSSSSSNSSSNSSNSCSCSQPFSSSTSGSSSSSSSSTSTSTSSSTGSDRSMHSSSASSSNSSNSDTSSSSSSSSSSSRKSTKPEPAIQEAKQEDSRMQQQAWQQELKAVRAYVFEHHIGDGKRNGRKAILKPLKGRYIADWYFTLTQPQMPMMINELEEERQARVELARATGGGPPKKGQGKRAKK